MGYSMTQAKKAEVFLLLTLGHFVVLTSGLLFRRIRDYKQSDFTQNLIARFSDQTFRVRADNYAGTLIEFMDHFIYYSGATIAIGGLQILCSLVTWRVLFVYGEKSLAGGCCYKVFEVVNGLTLAAISAIAIVQAFFPVGFHAQRSLALGPVESGRDITFEYWAWIGSMSVVAIYTFAASCIVGIYKTWKKVEKTAAMHEKQRSEPNQSVVLTEGRNINVKLNDV